MKCILCGCSEYRPCLGGVVFPDSRVHRMVDDEDLLGTGETCWPFAWGLLVGEPDARLVARRIYRAIRRAPRARAGSRARRRGHWVDPEICSAHSQEEIVTVGLEVLCRREGLPVDEDLLP